MTKPLLLHRQTEEAMQHFLAAPTHALMIVGPIGSGKMAIATHVGAQLLHTPVDQNPHVAVVRPNDNSTIGIEAIRGLDALLALRVPGAADAVKRLIILENVQSMTDEAANALLKTLEEPPVDTVLLLTASSDDAVLPTIRSRVQLLRVVQPNTADMVDYFQAAGYGPTEINQALQLSGPLPGLVSAVLDADASHPLVTATDTARSILKANLYERLAMVDGLSKQRDQLGHIIYILGQMSRAALARTTDAATATRWQGILRASYDAGQQLTQNGNAKLIALNLLARL